MSSEDTENRILSFDDWVKSFEVDNPEERVALSKDAARLLKDRGFMRVIAEMERNALRALRACSLKDRDRLFELKCLLHGVMSLRRALEGIIAVEEHKRKRAAVRD